MNHENRREFLFRAAGAITAVGALSSRPAGAAVPKMRMCLNTGNIGVRASLAESIAYASKYGFQAVDPNVKDLAALSDSGMAELLEEMRSKNLEFGQVFQGVPAGQTDDRFSTFLEDLAVTAKTMERAHARRFTTWLSCTDDKLTYLQNFHLHTRRISEAAAVLGDHGIKLGLEYVGPKTSWARRKYPFIHTMQELKELIVEIGKPNVGYLLDSWHWYTAGETAADVLTLKSQDIIAVHLNDAPAGVAVDQQVDNVRALPMATGVIDTGAFLTALSQLGYDGPVVAEPFDAELRKQPPEQALARTAKAMQEAFTII